MKKVARLLPIVIMVLLVAALSVSTVLAAPGGNGKGKGNAGGNGGGNGGANEQTAELWTEPGNPYPAYGFQFVVRGSGFNPDSTVNASFSSNGSCCLTFNVSADGNGEISFPWTTGAPGTYTFHAYQDLKGRNWSIWAEVKVEVTDL